MGDDGGISSDATTPCPPASDEGHVNTKGAERQEEEVDAAEAGEPLSTTAEPTASNDAKAEEAASDDPRACPSDDGDADDAARAGRVHVDANADVEAAVAAGAGAAAQANGGGGGAGDVQGPPPDLVAGGSFNRPPTRTTHTTLIRHAEGEHNVVTSSIVDASWSMLSHLRTFQLGSALGNGSTILRGALQHTKLRDPGLTDRGIAQAVHASDSLGACDFDIVYASPMWRTVQTALHVFGHRRGLRIVLHPGCCETRTMFEGSNAGRARDALERDIERFIAEHGCEASVDTAWVPNQPWWVAWAETANQLHERAKKFRAFLMRQRYERVAVVSHGAFLRVLADEDYMMDNCAFKAYTCTPYGMVSAASPPPSPTRRQEVGGDASE